MMTRAFSLPLRLLFCALALLCAFPLPAVAADTPTISQPRTYHYHADVMLNVAGEAVTGVGDGDFDFVNRAFRVVATSGAGGAQLRIELALVDGKLYLYDERQRRWIYETLTPAEVDELFSELLVVPQHPTAEYAPDGSEQIGDDETARWRASGAYNVLIPLLTPRGFVGSLLEEMLTAELAIGKANGYLYRASIQEQGKVTNLGGPSVTSDPVSSKTVYTYSNFDQPVTITAPAGAIPAENPVDPELPTIGGLSGAVVWVLATPYDGQGLAAVLAGLREP